MPGSNNLFNDFNPAAYEDWKKQALKELKDKSFDDALTWKPFETTIIESYYSFDHFSSLNEIPVPVKDEWDIRQEIKVTDVKSANKKALDILMKGVTSLGFDLGKKEFNSAAVQELLKDILPEYVSINFLAGDQSPAVLDAFNNTIKNSDFTKSEITGSIDYDPVGDVLINKKSHGENLIKESVELINLAKKEIPNYRVIQVNGLHYNYQGSIIHELAYSVAHGNEYLNYFKQTSSVDDLAPRMQFSLGIGSSYLLEIAKLRAFRSLWRNIVKQYNPKHSSSLNTFIHCETSRFNLTETDPHSNILRATTEAMSAIMGGADSLTIIPFDSIVNDSNEFSERIARNIQIILKEESYLNKVADPAKGSWYIESLTDKISQKAWAEFKKIEAMGGYLKAVEAGYISAELEKSFTEKKEAIDSGKMVLVGTNKYREKIAV